MSLDQRLPDLLERQARRASSVHPSLEAVHAAVARRRRRRRTMAAAVATAVLLAGTAGGLALLRNDSSGEPVLDRLTDHVPLVGVDLPGWTLVRTSRGPTSSNGGDEQTMVAFRDPDAPPGGVGGPLVTVSYPAASGDASAAFLDTSPSETPSGAPMAPIMLDDGGSLVVTGIGVDATLVQDYGAALVAERVQVAALPAPPGMTEREVVALPIDAVESQTHYEVDGGTVDLRVTGDPRWYTFLLWYYASTYGEFDTVDVGASLLGGTNRALLGHPQPGHTYALWRTERGFTLEVIAETDNDELVADLIAQAPFVEIAGEPQPTTTTVPTTGGAGHLVDFRGNDQRLELEFADLAPRVIRSSSAAEAPARCAEAVARYEELGLQAVSWLAVEVEGQVEAAEDGPLVDDDSDVGAVVCDHASANPVIAVPLPSEPTTIAVSDRPDPPSILIVLDGETPPATSITDIRVVEREGFDRVVIEFADALPDIWEITTSEEPLYGDCGADVADAAGYVNVHMTLTATPLRQRHIEVPLPDGSVMTQMIKTCEENGTVDFVIALDERVQLSLLELHGPPRAAIDIPR